jgi:two-component system CheB/CheR fusion protein
VTDAGRAREFDELIGYLTESCSFDFGGYKRVGLTRRILKRMRAVGITRFAEYRLHLEEHPDEFQQLFDTILINVTAFFRDDLPWDFIRGEVVPRILAQKEPHEPVRVWSAGCATGEEAYTLAMVLAEEMGHERFRDRAKVYATDVDDGALVQARQASYSEREVEGVPADLLEKYFERVDGRNLFRKDLRRCVIFGRNDLMRDAPISRIDLLSCRNTLMYFDAATQARILGRFHFALGDGGYLFLGRAETMMSHTGMFTPVDLRRRIFMKVPRPFAGDRQVAAPRLGTPTNSGAPRLDAELRDAAQDAGTVAQLVVDANGRLAIMNAQARLLFQLGLPDVGKPLQDFEVSYRPLELRSVVEQAYAELRPITRSEVPWRTGAGSSGGSTSWSRR